MIQRYFFVSPGKGAVNLNRALGRIDRAREFHQQPVTHSLDDAAVVLGGPRIEDFLAQHFELCKRPRG